ncbi:MAG: hypothetical protein JNL42_21140, partial [Anaerolineae bacterium]|nr:hypothetical protein [Anaerolineae bacterium]
MKRVQLSALVALTLLLGMLVIPAHSQDETVAVGVYVPAMTLPPQARLEGLRPVYQQL